MYAFHEHRATKGFLLYYYFSGNKGLSKDILDMMKNNNILLENDYVDVVLKAKNGSIYVPFYTKLYFTYINKQATTGLYFNKLNVNEVFVFETPINENMEKRKYMIDLLLNHLLENNVRDTGTGKRGMNNVATVGSIIGIVCIVVLLKKVKYNRVVQ
ncbi:MAG: hypothetical protein LBD48_15275 [Treponema sp.]|jgi:hypothetical protein|nr:hypothetical protein [Treponema sp.]